jgi:hypothetical protein
MRQILRLNWKGVPLTPPDFLTFSPVPFSLLSPSLPLPSSLLAPPLLFLTYLRHSKPLQAQASQGARRLILTSASLTPSPSALRPSFFAEYFPIRSSQTRHARSPTGFLCRGVLVTHLAIFFINGKGVVLLEWHVSVIRAMRRMVDPWSLGLNPFSMVHVYVYISSGKDKIKVCCNFKTFQRPYLASSEQLSSYSYIAIDSTVHFSYIVLQATDGPKNRSDHR